MLAPAFAASLMILTGFAGCQEETGAPVSADTEPAADAEDAAPMPGESGATEAAAAEPAVNGKAEMVLVGEGDAASEHKEVDFQEAINTEGKLVLVDFWATWCGPCRLLAPELEKVLKENPEKLVLVKVNVDNEEELAAHYKIEAIPDVRFFRDGKPVGGFLGFKDAAAIENELSL